MRFYQYLILYMVPTLVDQIGQGVRDHLQFRREVEQNEKELAAAKPAPKKKKK